MKPILLAKRFVAGENIEDALQEAINFKVHGISATLDHLGENVTDRRMANRSTSTYINILKKIGENHIDTTIAVKLSQIGLAIDKDLALKNAVKILKAAKELDLFVEIDMEGSRYTQDTVDIFHKLIKTCDGTLIAIQTALYRTEKDVLEVIKKKGKIRLVKGSYNESKDIAFPKMKQVRNNYIKLMKLYLEKGKYISIATHDEEIINKAIRFIKKNKVSKKRFSFAMLYGVRQDLQLKLAKDGYPVRVYVPYGDQWLPYFLRRIRERKENLLFAVKHTLGK